MQTTTIDNFVSSTGIIPSIIKMDIEGAEMDALRGALNTLKEYSPKCIIVCHTQDMPSRIQMFLKQNLPEWNMNQNQNKCFLRRS